KTRSSRAATKRAKTDHVHEHVNVNVDVNVDGSWHAKLLSKRARTFRFSSTYTLPLRPEAKCFAEGIGSAILTVRAMNFLDHIACPKCHAKFSKGQLLGLCTCGSPLLAQYDLKAARASFPRDSLKGR